MLGMGSDQLTNYERIKRRIEWKSYATLIIFAIALPAISITKEK